MSNWYVSESDSWYAPLQTQQAAPEKTKKKSRTWLRGLIAVAIIYFILAAVLTYIVNKIEFRLDPRHTVRKTDPVPGALYRPHHQEWENHRQQSFVSIPCRVYCASGRNVCSSKIPVLHLPASALVGRFRSSSF